MQAAPEPPPVVAPAPASAAAPPARLVLSRQDATVMVASRDVPLVLSKAGKLEYALLRQALFLTTSVTTTRPAERSDGPADAYGWSYKSYLQRQMCFNSITGLFSCTAGELEPLGETDEGQGPLAADAGESFPLADAARERLATAVRFGAAERFETDRRTHIDPVLRASAVIVVSPAAAAKRAPSSLRSHGQGEQRGHSRR